MAMKAMIQDNTRCIGCRACMVACKAWNDLPGDVTTFFAGPGYQNPRDLDPHNYTVITYNGIEAGPNGHPDWVFGRLLCMHCLEPACASACPTTALTKTPEGPVVFNSWRCIGCRYCMQACPFVVPKFDFDRVVPAIHKCTFCADRIQVGQDPACAQVCPTAAITFGERDDMIAEANRLPYGLAAYAWTSDVYRQRRLAAEIESGMVGINSHMIGGADAPFGGVKWSGHGSEDGPEGVLACMVLKAVHEG